MLGKEDYYFRKALWPNYFLESSSFPCFCTGDPDFRWIRGDDTGMGVMFKIKRLLLAKFSSGLILFLASPFLLLIKFISGESAECFRFRSTFFA